MCIMLQLKGLDLVVAICVDVKLYGSCSEWVEKHSKSFLRVYFEGHFTFYEYCSYKRRGILHLLLKSERDLRV